MSEATLTPESASDAAAGPRCGKCGVATDAAACPHCGWYPSLGIYVEIDRQFEAVWSPPTPDESAAPGPEGIAKHLAVWKGMIPWWGWVLVATAASAMALGIVARVATLASPTAQSWCGVLGLFAGLAIAGFAHVLGFVLESFEDADMGVADIVVKPFKVWKRVASALPERLWLAGVADFGVSLALSAALIVGGIPYDRLLDWGFKARAKPNLVGMIAEQAAKVEGKHDNLEDAMNDFTDKAGDVDGADGKAGKPAEATKPVQRMDCLIVGYQTDGDGVLRSLLLAADGGGRLRYVGKVEPRLEPQEAAELLAKLERNKAPRSLVQTSESGVWVRPKFTCRATYSEWPEGRRPKDLKWEELLDDLAW